MAEIGTATASDIEAVLEVACAIGFEADELQELRGLIEAFVSGAAGEGGCWHVGRESGRVVSVAYAAPERMTCGTHNLLLLAVRPSVQRRGLGESMLRHVEKNLSAAGGRLLLIETSATDDLSPARAFYRKNGYEEEARIRDYYDDGDDKVVYRKRLAGV